MSKKAYIFLADGFEDIEGLTVVDLLRRAGIDIKTVSIKETTQIQTSHGITMLTDTTFTETSFTDADILVLPGGMPGTKYLAAYKPLTDLLTDFNNKGKKIAYNLKTENLVEFEGNDNYEIQELQSLRSTYAFMNQSEGRALSDKALRQALLRGLDKQTYCDVLLEGGATAGKAPVPPTLDFGFDDLNDENSYDPEGAKAILDEAGYKDTDGDGFVETPDGDPLTLDFVIYTSRAELGVYAQAAQASLKEIGINVNLNTVSYETLLDMRDSGQYDLLIWNVLVANTGDPENYLRENWYSASANNTAGYNNPEVDELLDELAGTFDEEGRKDLIIKIQQDIMDDAATVFFGYETTYLFSNKRVTGVKMYPMDYYWLTKDITLAE